VIHRLRSHFTAGRVDDGEVAKYQMYQQDMTRYVIESQATSLQISSDSIALPSVTVHFPLLKDGEYTLGKPDEYFSVPSVNQWLQLRPVSLCRMNILSLLKHNATISLLCSHQLQGIPL
jgi:hypothetical protein